MPPPPIQGQLECGIPVLQSDNSMSNNQRHRRVILIFGDPNHGKSHLATQLRDNHGYHMVSLDELYVKFIQNHYPGFFLPLLREVIAQHYNSMFAQDSSRVAAWCQHVVATTRDASNQNHLVAVEGYLLTPALKAVEENLAGLATVTIVEARHRSYFVALSIEQIAQA